MLILISDPFGSSLPERLSEFGEVTDDKSRVAEAEVVLVRSKTKVTAAYIDGAPKLKYVIRGGVGLDNVDLEYAHSKGIRVDNTPSASSVAVAELAVTLMLSAINHVVAAHNGMAEGMWLKKELKRTELYRKTLGLIGIGRIGSAVAQRVKAFEMDVIGHDPFVEQHDLVELVELDEVLAKADVLSLHAPLTDQTRGMLDGKRLAQAKPGVVVVNTGRGECVDEAAMVAALEEGTVACYATDVWSSDPPPQDCPLLKAPRVLMTPHIGASSKENLGRIGDVVVNKLRDYAASK
jgi:D-3-phosphoglycerate dehydrogenase